MKLEEFEVLFDTEARRIRLTTYIMSFATQRQINGYMQESKNGDGAVLGSYISQGFPVPIFTDLTIGTKFFSGAFIFNLEYVLTCDMEQATKNIRHELAHKIYYDTRLVAKKNYHGPEFLAIMAELDKEKPRYKYSNTSKLI